MRMPELAEALKFSDDIIIIPHISPDGDALGSTLAMSRALLSMGKRARVVCDELTPRMYAFLPGAGDVIHPEQLDFVPRCALLMDVASSDRAGRTLALTYQAKTRLLVDHHETNQGFEGIAVVRPNASSTGEMTLDLLDELGVQLDEELSVLLYTAISTDTGNLSFNNTTPEALRAVARCIEAGLDIDEYNRRLFRLRSMPRTKLIGAGLSTLQTASGGRIAYAFVSKKAFSDCNAQHEDTEGLVNYLNEMEGVEVCFLAEERVDEVKFSLRSNGLVDVAQIAGSIGGGGHVRAAGLSLKMPLNAAMYKVLDMLNRALENPKWMDS